MRAVTATNSGAAGCGKARSRTASTRTTLFRARLANGGFDPYFISMHANTWGQRWFERHGKQTTNLASINLATLKSFPVPAPSLRDQQAVVAELRSITTSEERLRTDLERAERHSRTLRRSILAKAFTGRLVPQDPSDEHASRAAGPHRSISADQAEPSRVRSLSLLDEQRSAGAGHSVAFGWPTLTHVSHTVFFWSSMQYQIRPDPVTSYCHCLHLDAIDAVHAARALQPMLPAAASARLSRKRLPCRPRA